MENIHSPTIVFTSPDQTATPTRKGDSSTAELFALMEEKDRVESELKALGAVLDSHKVNMNTPLTTFDGYPRDNIDVPQIRTTRARIIHLRNDYNDLMKKIEVGLHAHHAHHAAAAETTVAAGSPKGANSTASHIHTPFAKINRLEPNSPAAEAGMQTGDYIKKFGSVDALNHDRLKKLTEVVSLNEGNPISVLLCRRVAGSDVDQEVTIVPRPWAGQGKLGCHILPL